MLRSFLIGIVPCACRKHAKNIAKTLHGRCKQHKTECAGTLPKKESREKKAAAKKTEGKRNEACGGEFVGCGGEAAERYGCCAGKEAASVAAVRLEQARLEIE